MFQAAKDAIAAKAAQTYLNQRIVRYGEVERVQLDSRARTVEATVRLLGESASVTVRIGRYEVRETHGGKRTVELYDCTCTRLWVERLLQDFTQGKRFDFPPWAAAIL